MWKSRRGAEVEQRTSLVSNAVEQQEGLEMINLNSGDRY